MKEDLAEQADALETLHQELEAAYMAPTWKYISSFISKTPKVNYRPWLWKWDDVIPLLMRAGQLITPERGAERRSMEHVNPDLPFSYSASHTIATAFQLVRAGEQAPAHRHAAGAIRFAARSHGGAVYTKVQGERLMMEENDLLLTPSGMWHEHANETPHDIVWLDVLDFPLVNLLQASMFWPGEGQVCPDRPDGWSNNRLGLFRPPADTPYPEAHPVLRYAWTEMREALHASTHSDERHGVLLEYVNPINSGPTLPTISCRAQLLRSHTHTRALRATASTVYFVIGGEGSTIINGVEFPWRRGDVFVVPPWCWHEHRSAGTDSYLFSASDQPVMRILGLYCEEALGSDGGHQKVESTFQS
ncbi:5-aminosalicylate 1,2-dioxygenase [Pusillimonas noertemannii]|uniref:Gentisate 1,2-dioxygenase n=1 Tax=Pusillimonas noertemannii TaxID=305977 RepID=A0A2U1CH05_9BURK|nr:cupin domain-containing protein [Pusillimonas noertemannii]NYT68212.1 cupin domain-containing protein [Pusillimonas noertemannii]PVY60182.1 gentisate 1,2-dioxygenase [Pusillimonas noertemannii]TFL10294.1 cupin domain-containing protein [Pusillimonas noertemannii]